MANDVRVPMLDTVWSVERTIAKLKEPVNIKELKQNLQKQIQHQSLNLILDYLIYSKKIQRTSNGVEWVYNEKMAERKIVKRLSMLLNGGK